MERLPILRLSKPALDQQDFIKLDAMMKIIKDQVEKLDITLVNF